MMPARDAEALARLADRCQPGRCYPSQSEWADFERLATQYFAEAGFAFASDFMDYLIAERRVVAAEAEAQGARIALNKLRPANRRNIVAGVDWS